MTQWTTIPLQSYDLAKYGKPVPCYVCDADNRVDSAFCQRCHAPLVIGYPNEKKPTPPRLINVLGSAGVGKTCYLGLLMDMLSRRPSDMQLMARGAYSVTLQQQTMSALASRLFPPATPNDPAEWMWIHCGVCAAQLKHPLELVLPDVSGERATLEVESPDATPTVRRMIAHSAATMILVDAEAVVKGVNESEFLAMKVINHLLAGKSAAKRKSHDHPVVAVLFTKADRCDWAFESPDEFARRYVPGLWRLCQEQLHRHRFFATSVAVVATAIDSYGERLHVPLRIEPRGVVEPFAWIVDQMGS